MRLDQAMWVDYIIIRNRSDIYGARSNSLNVFVGFQDKFWVAYDPYSAGHLGWLFELLRTTHAVSEDTSGFRLNILNTACDAAISAKDPKSAKIWQYLQLISQTGSDQLLKAANIKLLAGVTARYHAVGYEIETRDLHQFSDLLTDKRDIIAYENAFNRYLRPFTSDVVSVSRHFIAASKLLTQRVLYCSLIKEIHEIARECGREVFLGYGTLLGCVREKGFIAHDDDIDLILRVPLSDGGTEITSRQILFKRLEERGYQVEQFIGYEHHNLKKCNVCIELFPAYEKGDTVRLYMESMQFRVIPSNIMFPLQPGRLYEIDICLPAKPDDFLYERYGSSWKRPDRFYEWRWELKGDDPSITECEQCHEALHDFDEERYLKLHPDVARAVQAGLFKNGRSHFEKFGRSEDRQTR
jgi:hypothetical protein